MKKLSEMSLTELWTLFPIFLLEHTPDWLTWYEEEKDRLEEQLPQEKISRISHVGSTAIPNIKAKNIVDILVEVPGEIKLSCFVEAFSSLRYLCMSESEKRISFNKGYTSTGFADRVFHLHLRYLGDCDELYFRDYLLNNPGIAREYEKLKLDLAQKYPHNRDAYTEAKTIFIQRHSQIAKKTYQNRYANPTQ